MKRVFILFLILTSILQIACTQDNYNDFVGSWVLKESNGELIYECPDEIVLNKDKTYEILNECYGTDMRKPIIEKGTWHFNIEKECVIFSNRVMFSSYVFQNKNLELSLFIHEFKNTEIAVSYSKEEASVKERYFKRYTP